MEKDFWRTNKTDLTNDELMIFDAVFDLYSYEHLLRKAQFGIVYNLPYEHSVSDERLPQFLTGLKQRNLLKSRRSLYVRKSQGVSEKRNVYTLTAAGGKLWSMERNPDWERYVVHLGDAKEEGVGVEVFSPSARTLDEYIKSELNWFNEKLNVPIEATFKTLENKYLLPWKRFSKVYVASWFEPFSLLHPLTESSDRQQKTIVWSTVNELIGNHISNNK